MSTIRIVLIIIFSLYFLTNYFQAKNAPPQEKESSDSLQIEKASDTGNSSDENLREYFIICEITKTEVSNHLKSPLSAKFPDCAWESNKYNVGISPDKKTVVVSSYVDSQNEFGAMLRQYWIAKLITNSAENLNQKWKVDSVYFQP